MHPTKIVISLLVSLVLSSPAAVHAFWGSDGDRQSGLNLDTGYDVNTVASLNGRVVSVLTGDDHRVTQLEMESGGARAVVVLGPRRYWAEHGFALKPGDEVVVRGSRAQGKDGVVYILAQKITSTPLKASVSLRSESGRPAWAGGGMGIGSARMDNRPARMHQQSPGRMGGGRMGR